MSFKASPVALLYQEQGPLLHSVIKLSPNAFEDGQHISGRYILVTGRKNERAKAACRPGVNAFCGVVFCTFRKKTFCGNKKIFVYFPHLTAGTDYGREKC